MSPGAMSLTPNSGFTWVDTRLRICRSATLNKKPTQIVVSAKMLSVRLRGEGRSFGCSGGLDRRDGGFELFDPGARPSA